MPLSQTLTLSHGREFGGSNRGVRLDDSADPVAMDPGFFTITDAASATTGNFIKATFRQTTAWVHLSTDLWLANLGGTPTGSRTDLGVDLYSPTTDRWCRLNFETYQTTSSRSDGLAQVSFDRLTAVPTGISGRTYQSLNDWAIAVEAELPHDVDITFRSASSTSRLAQPGTPLHLGDSEIVGVMLGDETIARMYLGDRLLYQAAG